MKQKITKPEQKSENNKKQNNPSNEAKMKQTSELSTVELVQRQTAHLFLADLLMLETCLCLRPAYAGDLLMLETCHHFTIIKQNSRFF